MERLVVILDNYDEYLRAALDRLEKCHNQTEDEHLRNAILARDLRHGLKVNPFFDKRFVGLREVLVGKGLFEAVSLSDLFPSVGDRREKKRHRRAVDALLTKGYSRRLAYLGLGGKPPQEYVWLIPKDGDLRDSAPVDLTGGDEEEGSNDEEFGDVDGAGVVRVETFWTEATIMSRNNQMKELVDLAPGKRRVASRAMVADVGRRLGPLATRISKATLNFMYTEMTGIPAPNSHGAAGKDQRSRLAALVATGDANIIIDLRKLNGSDGKAFDFFWDSAEGTIEDLVKPKVHACVMSA